MIDTELNIYTFETEELFQFCTNFSISRYILRKRSELRYLKFSLWYHTYFYDGTKTASEESKVEGPIHEIRNEEMYFLQKLVYSSCSLMLLQADEILLTLLSSGARQSCQFRLKGIVIERLWNSEGENGGRYNNHSIGKR